MNESATKTILKDLEERIKRLDQLSGQIPDKLIEEAKQALIIGDNVKADQLFTQIEEQAEPHIAAAAEAAYQRGKLSEDAIQYDKAFQHYHRAIQLMPDNPLYLEIAGSMAGIVANHQKQIEWEQKALAIYLKQNRADSTDVARLRNNLGLAWESLGDYQKAIEYFKLALASGLKTCGESLFLRKLVLGIPAQASGKNLTRLIIAFGAPAALRPCHFATPSQARRWLRNTTSNG